MFKQYIVAASLFLVPAQAWAACTQADLQGFWRFNFDMGEAVAPAQGESVHIARLSCILKIKGDGAIAPGACEGVDASGGEGGFQIASSNRKLVMNSNNCQARFSGSPVYTNDFGLRIRNTTYSINTTLLSISPDKQMLLGWMGIDISTVGPRATVIAQKIATP